jgi:hypothetical protein
MARYLSYDELKGQLLTLNVPRRDDCPVFSPNGGVIGLGDLESLPDFEGGRSLIYPEALILRNENGLSSLTKIL